MVKFEYLDNDARILSSVAVVGSSRISKAEWEHNSNALFFFKKSSLSEGETPTIAYPFASIASDSCRDVPHLKQFVLRLKLFIVH